MATATQMKKRKNHCKNWKKEEEEYLLDQLGSSTVSYIAARLGRSTSAVTRKLERLGSSDKTVQCGAFRTYELSKILGTNPTTMDRWMKEEGLPYKELLKDGVDDTKKRYRYIFPEQFWKWAKNHKHLINFSKLQRGILLPEPEWLEKQIQIDRKQKGIKGQSLWSDMEDKQAWDMFYRQNMTQKQIGEALGRTTSAVQKRLAVLRRKRIIS